MMRREVKIGLAIGGVALSVIIVYALVATGGSSKPEVSLVTEQPKSTEPAKPEVTSADSEKKEPSTQPQQVADKPPVDPFASTNSEPKKSEGPWANGVLQTGSLPVMLSTTPQTPAPPTPNIGAVPAEANRPTPGGVSARTGAASNTPDAITPAPQSSGPGAATRPQQSRISTPRTHVVQSGETFSSIALAVYGNASYYAHIIRANPDVDPHRLRPGMTINLPAVADVRADNTPMLAASSGSSQKVDPRTQYVVQEGDSLYKIATRLYGKPDRADELFEANRAVIGSNPAKLKIGMVLKLPEPLAKAQ
jgi:nucleoid-associated protein YgaU